MRCDYLVCYSVILIFIVKYVNILDVQLLLFINTGNLAFRKYEKGTIDKIPQRRQSFTNHVSCESMYGLHTFVLI